MKWITHQTGALVLAAGLQLPVEGILAASAGAVLPDVIDMRISTLGPTRKSRQKIFNQIHRGASHWFGWWLALFLAALTLNLSALPVAAAAGVAFGALSHVFLDMLTVQGVPLSPFSRKNRFSLKLCKTGHISEYLFLLLLVLCGLLTLNIDYKPLLDAIRAVIQ